MSTTPDSSQPALSSLPRYAPGEMVSRYRIKQVLDDSAGFLYLYEAEDVALQRPVALRMFQKPAAVEPELSDSQLRFGVVPVLHQLARSKNLNHPNICKVFDVGFDRGYLYATSELLTGNTLSILTQRAVDLSDVVTYGHQIASALAAAHELGVYHGALFSEHVTVTAQGAKLSNFGIARLVSREAATVQRSGPVWSAPVYGGYSDDEQLHGDLFLAGVMLYEMVAGGLYGGQRRLRLTKPGVLASNGPPRPRMVNPNVSAELERVIARALDSPGKGYANAAELRDDLARLGTQSATPGGFTAFFRTDRAAGGEPQEAQAIPQKSREQAPGSFTSLFGNPTPAEREGVSADRSAEPGAFTGLFGNSPESQSPSDPPASDFGNNASPQPSGPALRPGSFKEIFASPQLPRAPVDSNVGTPKPDLTPRFDPPGASNETGQGAPQAGKPAPNAAGPSAYTRIVSRSSPPLPNSESPASMPQVGATPAPQWPSAPNSAGPDAYTRVVSKPGPAAQSQVPRVTQTATAAAATRHSKAPEIQVMERSLDLALPAVTPVLKPMQLVALLRRPDGIPLADLLARDRDTDLKQQDVRSRNFGLEFLRDRAGRLTPVDVTMRAYAPDFEPQTSEKVVRVRAESDCERQEFLLRPRRTGTLQVQFELLMGNLTVASRTLRTEAATDDRALQSHNMAVVTVPLTVEVKPRRRWAAAVAVAALILFVAGVGWAIRTWIRSGSSHSTIARNTSGDIDTGNTAGARGYARQAQTGTSAAPIQDGPSFAFVVGIDHYPNDPGIPKLNNAISDARAIANALEQEYGFELIKHKLFLDATRDDIEDTLSEMRNVLPPNSNLLVYYAGHGYYDSDSKEAYWIPADATRDHISHWIAAHTVLANLNAIRNARHILVISDSCFSGKMGSTRAAGDMLMPKGVQEYLARMRQHVSRNWLSSGGNEVVTDGDGAPGHSLFASEILKGLNGYPRAAFSGQELFNTEIYQQVAGKSHQTPQYSFFLDSDHDGGDFVFMRKSPTGK